MSTSIEQEQNAATQRPQKVAGHHKRSRSSGKPDVNTKAQDGKTPLHHAVISGNVEAVKSLMAAGANPNIRDNSRKTAVDYAFESQNQDLIKILTPIVLENVDCTIVKGYSSGDISCVAIVPEFPKQFQTDVHRRALITEVITPEGSVLLSNGIPGLSDASGAKIEEQTTQIKGFLRDTCGIDETLVTTISETYTQGGVQNLLEANIKDSIGAFSSEDGFAECGKNEEFPKRIFHKIEVLDDKHVRLIEDFSFTAVKLHEASELSNLIEEGSPSDHLRTHITGKASVILSLVDGKPKYTIEKIEVNVSGADEQVIRERILDGLYSNSRVFAAERIGNTPIMKEAIRDGRLTAENVNEIDRSGKTLLHHAAKRGHLEIVALLIAMGAKYDIKDNAGETAETYLREHLDADPAMRAIIELLKIHATTTNRNSADNVKLVNALSELSKDVTLPDIYSKAVMIINFIKNTGTVVAERKLCDIKSGLDSNHQYASSLRIIPIMTEDASVQQQNLDAGRDYDRVWVETKSESQRLSEALILEATVASTVRQDMIGYLIKKGVNPKLAAMVTDGLNQKSILQSAVISITGSVSLDPRFGTYLTTAKDNTVISVKEDGSVHVTNKAEMPFRSEHDGEGFTAWAEVEHAFSLNEFGEPQVHVSAKASVFGENADSHLKRIEQGFTADGGLYFDARRGQQTTPDSITSENVNIPDSAGKTMLHYALTNGHTEYAAFLIRKGADVRVAKELLLEAKDQYGKTVLSYITQTREINKILGAIYPKGAKKSRLNYAIEAGNLELIRDLLADKGLTKADSEGKTNLHYAAIAYAKAVDEARNETDIKGYAMARRQQEIDRRVAAVANAEAIILALVDAGADVTVKDKEGKEPWRHANGSVQTYLYVLTGVEGYRSHLQQAGDVQKERLEAVAGFKQSLVGVRKESVAERLFQFKTSYQSRQPEVKPENTFSNVLTNIFSHISSAFKRIISSSTQQIINPARMQTHAEAFQSYIEGGNTFDSIDIIIGNDRKKKEAEKRAADKAKSVVPAASCKDLVKVQQTERLVQPVPVVVAADAEESESSEKLPAAVTASKEEANLEQSEETRAMYAKVIESLKQHAEKPEATVAFVDESPAVVTASEEERSPEQLAAAAAAQKMRDAIAAAERAEENEPKAYPLLSRTGLFSKTRCLSLGDDDISNIDHVVDGIRP